LICIFVDTIKKLCVYLCRHFYVIWFIKWNK
jgi:hypothetical protein